MGSPAVDGHGILHMPLPPRLTPSSPSFPLRRSDSLPSFLPCRFVDGILPTPHFSTRASFPFRRSDSPPSLLPGHFDDGILPTPHFSTRLPPHSCLRRSGSSPWRSGPPQPASVTPVSLASPSTLWAHLLSFSPLPSPPLPTPSSQQPPALASLPIPSPLPSSLPSLLASLHSLFLHLHQVVQCDFGHVCLCLCVCECECECVCVWFMWVCICACMCDCRHEYFKSKSEYSLIGICLSIHSCDIGAKESRMNSGLALPRATYYLTRIYIYIYTNDIVPRQPKGCCHQGERGVVTNSDASPRRLLPIVIVATFCRQWCRAARKRLTSMKSLNCEPGTPIPFSSTPSTGPQCLSRPSRSMVDLPPLVARYQSLLLTL